MLVRPGTIARSLLRVSEILGLTVMFSIQHSCKRSHKTSVIPIPSAFPGLAGRSPKITARITLAFLLGSNGRLPVRTW